MSTQVELYAVVSFVLITVAAVMTYWLKDGDQ